MFRKAAALAIVAALFPALSFAGQAERSDAQIFRDISQQITTCPRFTVFDDVQVGVDEGVVTLFGRVTMPYKKDEIGQRVQKVAGVRQVVNKIGVLPVSRFDSDLRLQIARAIYGNPTFWQYGAMANPPIHIIVENGRVTLTGVVNNNVERMLARSIANRFNALAVVDQLRTEAEVRAELERIRGE